jgi:hypothetical protein
LSRGFTKVYCEKRFEDFRGLGLSGIHTVDDFEAVCIWRGVGALELGFTDTSEFGREEIQNKIDIPRNSAVKKDVVKNNVPLCLQILSTFERYTAGLV